METSIKKLAFNYLRLLAVRDEAQAVSTKLDDPEHSKVARKMYNHLMVEDERLTALLEIQEQELTQTT